MHCLSRIQIELGALYFTWQTWAQAPQVWASAEQAERKGSCSSLHPPQVSKEGWKGQSSQGSRRREPEALLL